MSVHRGVPALGGPGPGECLVRGSGLRGACSRRVCLLLGGGCLAWGVPGLGGCLVLGCLPGGAWSRGVSGLGGCLVETPQMATAVDSTHPAGMHSYLLKFNIYVNDKNFLTGKIRATEHQQQCCDVASDIALIELLRFLHKPSELL